MSDSIETKSTTSAEAEAKKLAAAEAEAKKLAAAEEAKKEKAAADAGTAAAAATAKKAEAAAGAPATTAEAKKAEEDEKKDAPKQFPRHCRLIYPGSFSHPLLVADDTLWTAKSNGIASTVRPSQPLCPDPCW